MKKILAVICCLSLIFSLVACSSEVSGNESGNGIAPSSSSSGTASQQSAVPNKSTTETQIYIQTNDGHTITFHLNESLAAKSFYEQLPLDILVEDYAKSEKIFYPPEKLDIVDAPMAEGPVGTIAYYEPWGNIAIFYEECDGASGLYELGEAVSGAEVIAQLSGEIHITTRLESNDKTIGNTITFPTLPPALEVAQPPVPEPETETDNEIYKIQILIGKQNFPTVLYKNEATDALMNRLPVTITMRDMNRNEKYHYFSDSLPTDTEKLSEIRVGDLMLYGADCLVLFYESFSSSYSYTTLGYVEDAAGLASALGSGDVQVSFEAE